MPQQGDFLHALVGQPGHFHQHVLERAAHLFAAGVGHHAVAAVLGAAFHDAHKGAGAFNTRGRQVVELFDLGKADVDLRAVQPRALIEHLRQPVQGLRAKHHVHIRRAGNDGLAFLARHATADANQGAALFQVLDAAQVREHLFLRLFAHRTGVEQDQVGLFHVVGLRVALRRAEHVAHLVRVVLVHLAAVGFDEYFFAHGDTLMVLALSNAGSLRQTAMDVVSLCICRHTGRRQGGSVVRCPRVLAALRAWRSRRFLMRA